MTTDYQRPPIRVALMGLGRAMFNDHYEIFKAHPALFNVAYACDLEKDRRDRVSKDFPKCKMFRQFADMLDERDIDLVDIATCTADHPQHAIESLKRGFWTLIESPLALRLDDAQLIRGQAMKARNRLIVMNRGYYAPDFMLARQEMNDARLGRIMQIRVREEDFVRRDDWQAVKRLGGGAAYYAMPDLMIKTLKLMPLPPVQMWSELKRIASLGDAEDYVHVCLKTREQLTVDIEYNGGAIPGIRQPSFVINGENGTFTVEAGATEGTLTVIDPDFKFPRRRSSVRTPPLEDLHEDFPIKTYKIELPKGTMHGPTAFWRHVYDSVRTAAPFPLTIEDAIEAVKFSQLMKQTSPFGK